MNRLLALAFLLMACNVGFAGAPEDPEGAAMLQEAQKLVAAYHAGQEPDHGVLRVVYFTGSDREPLRDYEARVGRIAEDVSAFYREGLERFGIKTRGLPLEKKNGRLVIHRVKGSKPAQAYSHESGDQTKEEIGQALRGTFDLDHEFVLILYGLCEKSEDGRYVFSAPYYGGGRYPGGLCHAADCELLDPPLLKAKDRQMVITEHYYPRLNLTVAEFNSMYLGGIAHELGHALGLPHDVGHPGEQGFGVSLMGGGNLTYRVDQWGGGSSSFLSRSSALRLLSNPLLTGTNRGRRETAPGDISKLEFKNQQSDLGIAGTVEGPVPAYAVIAATWPADHSTDHLATSYCALVRDGKFELSVPNPRQAAMNLRLSSLHANGDEAGFVLSPRPSAEAKWNLDELQAEWVVGRAESSILRGDGAAALPLVDETAQANAPTTEAKKQLALLAAILKPAEPVNLLTTRENEVRLSEAVWEEASVGHGQPARDHLWFDDKIKEGILLTQSHQFVEKALFAHSPSRYVFSVDQKWKQFTSTIGICDGTAYLGAAVFIVRGDGVELFRSGVLRDGQRKEVKLSIEGVRKLELLAEGNEGKTFCSYALWMDPKVTR